MLERAAAAHVPAGLVWRHNSKLALIRQLRALSGRRQRQDGAELLAQSEFVDLLPVLGQFSVCDPVNRDPTYFDALPGRGNTHVFAEMRPLPGSASHDLVAFGNDIVDGDCPI